MDWRGTEALQQSIIELKDPQSLRGWYSMPQEIAQIPVLDGSPTIDTFQVQTVIEYNSFGYTSGRFSRAYGNAVYAEEGARSSGLWCQASYMNHACLFNAQRSFIGDMMIVRATKDIPGGTEITIPYVDVIPDTEKRQ
jgi:hypothetical protein